MKISQKACQPKDKKPCMRKADANANMSGYVYDRIKWKTAMTNLAAEDLVRRGGSRNHNDPISTPSDLLPRVSFVGLETELRNLTGRLRKT